MTLSSRNTLTNRLREKNKRPLKHPQPLTPSLTHPCPARHISSLPTSPTLRPSDPLPSLPHPKKTLTRLIER
ncbi:hypothetical protein E2C01_068807 [Portunus trituberculatus]|uniref:Uncharacterized protein n=1 Tax=Portunus trituberculatus TaxID=210409 RepID=A0A5B7I0I3_PORTR|nr:hypothetical protein [Portunus trituberculatus]